MKLIEQIEKYRETNRLSKADMARLFGVPLQNYNNWVYRSSLPKEHYEFAQSLISKNSSKALVIDSILSEAKDLTLAQQEEVLRYVRFQKSQTTSPSKK